MSTEVGKLHYTLDLDDSRFKSELKQSSAEAQGFGGTLHNLAGFALTAVKVAAVAAGAAIVGMGLFAVKSAEDMQQNRIAFETMLGSAEKAGNLLKEIGEFARKTPFELPQVVEGAKSLLAYGISAEKIIPTFAALGNIAAGVGKDKLPQLTLAFGQVKAAGQLTGAELRQFTEAGVPLLEVLAKQSGKTAAQVKADMEAGIAPSFAEVESALFSMSQEGGKFFNLMEKQSQTFGGVMSNLKDNFIRLGLEIVGVSETGEIKQGGIFYHLSNAAKGFYDWLEANKGTIAAAFNSIWTGLQWAWENIIQPVFNWLRDIAPPILGYLKLVWEALRPGFEQLWVIISTQLWPALKELWKAIEPYAPYIGGALLVVLGALIASFLVAAMIIGTVITVVIKLITWIIQLHNWFQNLSVNANRAVIGFLTNIANAIAGFVGRMWSAGSDIVNGLVRGIQSGAGAVIDTIKRIAQGALDQVKRFFGISSPSRVMAGIGNNIMQGLTNGIMSGTSGAIDAAGSAANGILNSFGQPTIGANVNANIEGSDGTLAGGKNVYNINMSGVMTRSRSDERAVAQSLIESINEEKRAKGQAEL